MIVSIRIGRWAVWVSLFAVMSFSLGFNAQSTSKPNLFIGLDFGNSVESLFDDRLRGVDYYEVDYGPSFLPGLEVGVESEKRWKLMYRYQQSSDIFKRMDWRYGLGLDYITEITYKQPETHALLLNVYPYGIRGFNVGIAIIRRSGFDNSMAQEYDIRSLSPWTPTYEYWNLSIQFQSRRFYTFGLGIGYDFYFGSHLALSTGMNYYYVSENSIHRDVEIRNTHSRELISDSGVFRPVIAKTRYAIPLDVNLGLRYRLFNPIFMDVRYEKSKCQ